MGNDDFLPSLDELQAKIDEIKKSEKSGAGAHQKADMSQALRLLIDLVAGVIMGVGVGYFIDRWLDKTPLFMVIGLFFGMAAGVKNMVHSAGLIDKKRNEQQKNNKDNIDKNV